jgi:hypothetical protein
VDTDGACLPPEGSLPSRVLLCADMLLVHPKRQGWLCVCLPGKQYACLTTDRTAPSLLLLCSLHPRQRLWRV